MKYYRSAHGSVVRKASLINVFGKMPDGWERVTVKPKKHWEWRLRGHSVGDDWTAGEHELNPSTTYRLRPGTEGTSPILEYHWTGVTATTWYPCVPMAGLEVRKVR